MRAAVYSGTRNIYSEMVTSAKSLIAHSSVEKIYFLIEDDKFPEELPPLIETINVSGQTWFPPDGPNSRSIYTYMAMIRCCHTEILPKSLDKVLSLDCDVIVVDDVDALWDIDLTRKWFAAAEEMFTTRHQFGVNYYNIGVAVFNLAEIRKSNVVQEMVQMLNTRELGCIEQDAWNILGVPRKVVPIPSRYNECYPVGYTDNPAVVHFAGFRNYIDNPQAPRREYIKKYQKMTWEEALKCRQKPEPAKKPARSRKAKAES